MTSAMSLLVAARNVFWLCQVLIAFCIARCVLAENRNFDDLDLIWADPRSLEPLHGNATDEQLKYLPYFVLSKDGCMPAPAIDAESRLSFGLPHTRSVNGDCLPLGKANIYSQKLSVGASTALAYALYFPKDGAAPFGVGGHRHDWEYVIVWTKDEQVTAVTFHQHKGWYTQPRGQIELREEHPVIYVGRAKHGMYHKQHAGPGGVWSGICYFCDDRGKNASIWYAPDALLDVDLLSPLAKRLLSLKLWGKANSPFRDDVFLADAQAIAAGERCRGLGCRCREPAEQCPTLP